MTDVLMPAWVVPVFDRVAEVRHRAMIGTTLREPSWLGVARTFDWVAGIQLVTPLSSIEDAPSLDRATAERMCAWELLTGRPVAEDEYGRLGYVPLAPDESLMDQEYAGGVWHALAWLLGEERQPPGTRYQARRAAG